MASAPMAVASIPTLEPRRSTPQVHAYSAQHVHGFSTTISTASRYGLLHPTQGNIPSANRASAALKILLCRAQMGSALTRMTPLCADR
jgi:hypothetical protein